MALVAFWFGKSTAAGIGDRGPVVFALLAIIAEIGAFAFGMDIEFDMKALRFGPPVLGIALALGLSLVFIRICMSIGNGWILHIFKIIGAEILTIMMLHQFVHFTSREFGISNILLLLTMSLTIPLAVSTPSGKIGGRV